MRADTSRPVLKCPIPGPRTAAVVARDRRALVTSTKTAPVSARRAKGVVVEDLDGNLLLDFAAGIGVLNTGHCHPAVVKAVQDQSARLMHFAGTDFYYPEQVDLAQRLGRLAPVLGAGKTFFSQSGTEANEAAIKVAKHHTKRPLFLSFYGAFHGRSQGSLSLTASKSRQREGFFPTMPGVFHAPYPNPYRNPWGIDGYAEPTELANRAVDWIERLFETVMPAEDTAACFYEPIQGEGGYVVPPKPFPRMLRRLLDDHGILLAADEVQTGLGRTGRLFALEHWGVKADTVSMAKALGSGFPIGATVVRRALDFDRKGRHSNTYGGNPVGCAAAMATLDVMEEEKLVERSARLGPILATRLREAQARHQEIGDVRGLGLMQAIEFVDAKGRPDARRRDAVEKRCWQAGLILLGTGQSGLRFIPPLVVTEAQIHGAIDVLDGALKAR